MKKILMSLLTIAIVGALITGGAVAYFSEVETIGPNQFTAGTIDIELAPGDGYAETIDLYDMKPCDMVFYTFLVHNDGNNPGPLYLHFDVINSWEEKLSDAGDDEVNDIENWITVNLVVDKVDDVNGSEEAEVILFPQNHVKLGWLDCKWIPLDTALNGWLKPCEWLEVTLSFHLQAETPNDYQGDAVSFNVEVMMTDHNMPPPDPIVLFLENKKGIGGQDVRMWEEGDDMWGFVKFDPEGDTFDYKLRAYGLVPEKEYSLIYYADPWKGTNSVLIGTHTTNANGKIIGAAGDGSTDLGMDLPSPPDTNYPTGAKIWLVPSSDYTQGSGMTSWNPGDYLYETALIKYYDTDKP